MTNTGRSSWSYYTTSSCGHLSVRPHSMLCIRGWEPLMVIVTLLIAAHIEVAEAQSTTAGPTTAIPTTIAPTTAPTAEPTPAIPTTIAPSTAIPTTTVPTTATVSPTPPPVTSTTAVPSTTAVSAPIPCSTYDVQILAGPIHRLNGPTGIAVTSTNAYVVADDVDHRIVYMPNGGIAYSLLAGGTRGYSDGLRESAQFDAPNGLAVTSNDTVVVADSMNYRIRLVTLNGVFGNVSTLAGSGSDSNSDGIGANAAFQRPWGVAVTADDIIVVTDMLGHRIRLVTLAGTVTTLAGGGYQGYADGKGANGLFSSPRGVAVTSQNIIVVGDTNNHRIRLVTLAGDVSTLAGSSAGFADGTGIGANFNLPYGVAVTGQDEIIVADFLNSRIRHVTLSGVVTSIVGSSTSFADGPGIDCKFNKPYAVAVGSSNVTFVTDYYNYLVRTVSGGVCATPGGSLSGHYDAVGPFAKFQFPFGVAVASDGSFVVSDSTFVRRVTLTGDASTIAGNTTPGYADGSTTQARFNSVQGVALTSSGIILLADAGNNRIRLINVSGNLVATLAGSSFGFVDGVGPSARFHYPRGIAVTSNNTAVVADTMNHRIRLVTLAGVVTTLAGNFSSGTADGVGTSATFFNPSGVTVGQGDIIVVADSGNNRIRLITLAGVVTTLAGSSAGYSDGNGTFARFSFPVGLSIRNSDNTIVVADANNHLVRLVTFAGTVTTLAGSSQGFASGLGSEAKFNSPFGVAAASGGRIIVADAANYLIRQMRCYYTTTTPLPSTIATVPTSTAVYTTTNSSLTATAVLVTTAVPTTTAGPTTNSVLTTTAGPTTTAELTTTAGPTTTASPTTTAELTTTAGPTTTAVPTTTTNAPVAHFGLNESSLLGVEPILNGTIEKRLYNLSSCQKKSQGEYYNSIYVEMKGESFLRAGEFVEIGDRKFDSTHALSDHCVVIHALTVLIAVGIEKSRSTSLSFDVSCFRNDTFLEQASGIVLTDGDGCGINQTSDSSRRWGIHCPLAEKDYNAIEFQIEGSLNGEDFLLLGNSSFTGLLQIFAVTVHSCFSDIIFQGRTGSSKGYTIRYNCTTTPIGTCQHSCPVFSKFDDVGSTFFVTQNQSLPRTQFQVAKLRETSTGWYSSCEAESTAVCHFDLQPQATPQAKMRGTLNVYSIGYLPEVQIRWSTDSEAAPKQCTMVGYSVVPGSSTRLGNHTKYECFWGAFPLDIRWVELAVTNGTSSLVFRELLSPKAFIAPAYSTVVFDLSLELSSTEEENCLLLQPDFHHYCDKKCIPKKSICDGITDCEDRSDEAHCPAWRWVASSFAELVADFLPVYSAAVTFPSPSLEECAKTGLLFLAQNKQSLPAFWFSNRSSTCTVVEFGVSVTFSSSPTLQQLLNVSSDAVYIPHGVSLASGLCHNIATCNGRGVATYHNVSRSCICICADGYRGEHCEASITARSMYFECAPFNRSLLTQVFSSLLGVGAITGGIQILRLHDKSSSLFIIQFPSDDLLGYILGVIFDLNAGVSCSPWVKSPLQKTYESIHNVSFPTFAPAVFAETTIAQNNTGKGTLQKLCMVPQGVTTFDNATLSSAVDERRTGEAAACCYSSIDCLFLVQMINQVYQKSAGEKCDTSHYTVRVIAGYVVPSAEMLALNIEAATDQKKRDEESIEHHTLATGIGISSLAVLAVAVAFAVILIGRIVYVILNSSENVTEDRRHILFVLVPLFVPCIVAIGIGVVMLFHNISMEVSSSYHAVALGVREPDCSDAAGAPSQLIHVKADGLCHRVAHLGGITSRKYVVAKAKCHQGSVEIVTGSSLMQCETSDFDSSHLRLVSHDCYSAAALPALDFLGSHHILGFCAVDTEIDWLHQTLSSVPPQIFFKNVSETDFNPVAGYRRELVSSNSLAGAKQRRDNNAASKPIYSTSYSAVKTTTHPDGFVGPDGGIFLACTKIEGFSNQSSSSSIIAQPIEGAPVEGAPCHFGKSYNRGLQLSLFHTVDRFFNIMGTIFDVGLIEVSRFTVEFWIRTDPLVRSQGFIFMVSDAVVSELGILDPLGTQLLHVVNDGIPGKVENWSVPLSIYVSAEQNRLTAIYTSEDGNIMAESVCFDDIKDVSSPFDGRWHKVAISFSRQYLRTSFVVAVDETNLGDQLGGKACFPSDSSMPPLRPLPAKVWLPSTDTAFDGGMLQVGLFNGDLYSLRVTISDRLTSDSDYHLLYFWISVCGFFFLVLLFSVSVIVRTIKMLSRNKYLDHRNTIPVPDNPTGAAANNSPTRSITAILFTCSFALHYLTVFTHMEWPSGIWVPSIPDILFLQSVSFTYVMGITFIVVVLFSFGLMNRLIADIETFEGIRNAAGGTDTGDSAARSYNEEKSNLRLIVQAPRRLLDDIGNILTQVKNTGTAEDGALSIPSRKPPSSRRRANAVEIQLTKESNAHLRSILNKVVAENYFPGATPGTTGGSHHHNRSVQIQFEECEEIEQLIREFSEVRSSLGWERFPSNKAFTAQIGGGSSSLKSGGAQLQLKGTAEVLEVKMDVDDNDSECPIHHKKLVPRGAVEGFADYGGQYVCSRERELFFKLFFNKDDRNKKDTECNAQKLFVCSIPNCNYCICENCARFSKFDSVQILIAGKVIRLRRKGLWSLLGMLLLLLTQALSSPAVSLAVIVWVCDVRVHCVIPFCAKGSFDHWYYLVAVLGAVGVLILFLALFLVPVYSLWKRKTVVTEVWKRIQNERQENEDDETACEIIQFSLEDDADWCNLLTWDTTILRSVYDQFRVAHMFFYPFYHLVDLIGISILYAVGGQSLWQHVAVLGTLFLQLLGVVCLSPYMVTMFQLLHESGLLFAGIVLSTVLLYESQETSLTAEQATAIHAVATVLYVSFVICVCVVTVIVLPRLRKKKQDSTAESPKEEKVERALSGQVGPSQIDLDVPAEASISVESVDVFSSLHGAVEVDVHAGSESEDGEAAAADDGTNLQSVENEALPLPVTPITRRTHEDVLLLDLIQATPPRAGATSTPSQQSASPFSPYLVTAGAPMSKKTALTASGFSSSLPVACEDFNVIPMMNLFKKLHEIAEVEHQSRQSIQHDEGEERRQFRSSVTVINDRAHLQRRFASENRNIEAAEKSSRYEIDNDEKKSRMSFRTQFEKDFHEVAAEMNRKLTHRLNSLPTEETEKRLELYSKETDELEAIIQRLHQGIDDIVMSGTRAEEELEHLPSKEKQERDTIEAEEASSRDEALQKARDDLRKAFYELHERDEEVLKRAETIVAELTPLVDLKRSLEKEMSEVRENLDYWEGEIHRIHSWINGLEKSDFAELRGYSKPPPIVLILNDALCAVLGDPSMNWREQFTLKNLHRLQEVDPAALPKPAVNRLTKIMEDDMLTPEKILHTSRPCVAARNWLSAIVEFNQWGNAERVELLRIHSYELESRAGELRSQWERLEQEIAGSECQYPAMKQALDILKNKVKELKEELETN